MPGTRRLATAPMRLTPPMMTNPTKIANTAPLIQAGTPK